MQPSRTVPLLASLLAGAGVLLLLSNCEQTTTFIPYVKEICADRSDNDADGKVDCDDADCNAECSVDIAIVTPLPTSVDTLVVQGTSRNARSISVLVSPSPGEGGAARLDAATGDWTVTLRDLLEPGEYKVTAIASNQANRKDTATATVERRD